MEDKGAYCSLIVGESADTDVSLPCKSEMVAVPKERSPIRDRTTNFGPFSGKRGEVFVTPSLMREGSFTCSGDI